MQSFKKGKIICHFVFFLLLFRSPSYSYAQQSNLASLANSMAAGTWAELNTNNINPTLSANGASGVVLGFTDDIKWDPVSRQLLFAGGDHGEIPHFITYSESSNTWQRMPRPYWMPSTYSGTPMHGYDHSAIDVESGFFYHRPFFSRIVYKYNIATQTWGELTPIPENIMGQNTVAVGVEFFPEMNSLIYCSAESYNNGSLIRYNETLGMWQRIGPGSNLLMGEYHHFAEYNPRYKVAIFGGGNDPGSNKIYKVDRDGTITAQNDAPIGLGIEQTVITLDPQTGDYLIFNKNRKFYVYDVISDSWTLQGGNVPIWNTVYDNPIHAVAATPVSTYGVTLFVSCNGSGNCHVYLYKHSLTSNLPPQKVMNVKVLP